ncbi:MAG TPA: (5-formylfuran-3-yl)methyl phosphate synthase, partial [Planctomycetia bacterium]|nr:(5-formylfuran-3-yl)methyl phosphate synthase [Planctomycetia bacterium]
AAILARIGDLDRGVAVTAALGELGELERLDLESWPRGAGSLCKVGFAGESAAPDWRERFRTQAERLRERGWRLLPAAYLDHEAAAAPAPRAILDLAARAPGRTMLLDTFRKDRRWRDLLDRETAAALSAGRHRLALAGSFQASDVAEADAIFDRPPAIIAVRGAACRGADRGAPIDESKVRELQSALLAHAWRGRGEAE